MWRWQGHTYAVAIPMVDGCTFLHKRLFHFSVVIHTVQRLRVSCACVIWKTFNHTHITAMSYLVLMVKREHFHIFNESQRPPTKPTSILLKKIRKLFGKYLSVQLYGWRMLCVKLVVQCKFWIALISVGPKAAKHREFHPVLVEIKRFIWFSLVWFDSI